MPIYDTISILTTPIYIIAVYKAICIFLGERISSKKIELLSYSLYAITLTIFYIVVKIPILLLIFNIIAYFLISFNYSKNVFKNIICAFSVVSFFLVIEALVFISLGFFELTFFESSQYSSIIGLLLSRMTMLLFANLLHKYKKSKIQNTPVPPYYYIAHTLILFGILYLFILSFERDLLLIPQVIISSVIVLIINIMIIFVDNKIYDTILLNNERNMLKQQNTAYENQTAIINQSLTTIRYLKHDMKNHIISLESMYDNSKPEEAKEYAKNILEQMDGNTQFVQSNNFIIDSIVNFKLQELKNLAIDLNIDIKVSPQLNILAYDLTTILGNLLDNAVTALKQIPQSKDRKLNLSIYCNKGSLIILIDNSFNGKLSFKNGKFKTTKSVKSNHGFGLESVEKSVARYGGNTQIEHTDNIFSVAVLIPYTE